MTRTIAALLSLALAACATEPTRYAPALGPNDAGYREQRIETDRYRISFRANADLKPLQVEDLALRRAAEIATMNGRDWFRVVNRSTDVAGGSQSGGPTIGVGGSTGSWSSSLGIGLGFNLGGDTRQYESNLEVLLGKGVKPDDANAYDARAILSRRG